MDWKTKKRIIWTYAVASVITLAGAVIHPAMLMVGLAMCFGIMMFCMIDRD
jgi:hypothetical protein